MFSRSPQTLLFRDLQRNFFSGGDFLRFLYLPYSNLFYFLLGLSTEGIYRVSGNKSEMESLQRQFDQGKCHLLVVP